MYAPLQVSKCEKCGKAKVESKELHACMFPFKTKTSIKLKISFKAGDNKVIVEKWKEASEE